MFSQTHKSMIDVIKYIKNKDQTIPIYALAEFISQIVSKP